METELNSIIKHLKETEFELKKEQKEKTLLEFKFKQQQQDHSNQMNGLIDKWVFAGSPTTDTVSPTDPNFRSFIRVGPSGQLLFLSFFQFSRRVDS